VVKAIKRLGQFDCPNKGDQRFKTVNDQLKNIAEIEHSRSSSAFNFTVNVVMPSCQHKQLFNLTEKSTIKPSIDLS